MEGTLVGEVERAEYPAGVPHEDRNSFEVRLDSFWYVLVDRAFVSAGGFMNGSTMFGPRLEFFVGSADAPADIIALATEPRGRGNEAFWIDAKGRSQTSDAHLEGGWVGFARRDRTLVGAGSFFGTRFATIKGTPLGLADRKDTGEGVTTVMASVFGATSNGDIFIGGSESLGNGPFEVEVWKHGAEKSEIVPAAGKQLSIAGGEAFLLGSTVARWDGTSFVDVGPQVPDGANEVFAVGDGDWSPGTHVLFAHQEGEGYPPKPERLFVLDGRAWKSVVSGLPGESGTNAPTEGAAKPVYLFDGKHLWLIADALYQWAPAGAAAPAPIRLPDDFLPGDIDYQPPKFDVGGPKCTHNVVVLFGFTKVTPDDYTFPLTRKAVKGHTELSGVKFAVSRRSDHKYFVGLADDFKTATKLAQLVTKGLAGSSPQITCDEPEIVRYVDIDLATGEVRAPSKP